MAQPYITALIDTYNHECFLAEAIESVLAQDFPAAEMEVLVVDDGSTDSTPQVAARYSDRIRYIRKENGGQASALNLGFAEARGEIVSLLDGDDVWLPQKLSRVAAEFARSPEIGVVYHPHDSWIQDSGKLLEDNSFFPVQGRMPLGGEALLRYGNYGTSEMTLRRSLASAMFPVPERLWIYADSYLVFLAVFVGEVAGIAESLTKYRYHDANLASIRQRDEQRLKRRWECFAAAVAESKQWLTARGLDLNRRDIAAHVRRHELVAEMLHYSYVPPGRVEYMRHLLALQKLYRSLWTRRYSAFRSLLALAAFVLGYERFQDLRARYRGSSRSISMREGLFPASGEEAALP
jgi:glycosyltransferase involved in cell wall biosynthesis